MHLSPDVLLGLADALRAEQLAGVQVREAYFVPTFSKYAGLTCGGVQFHVRDADAFDSLLVGLSTLSILRKLYPSNFTWRPPASPYEPYYIDLLLGQNETRISIDRGIAPARIVAAWEADPELARFRRTRKQYLLYA